MTFVINIEVSGSSNFFINFVINIEVSGSSNSHLDIDDESDVEFEESYSSILMTKLM
jgi:hypothetical protein